MRSSNLFEMGTLSVIIVAVCMYGNHRNIYISSFPVSILSIRRSPRINSYAVVGDAPKRRAICINIRGNCTLSCANFRTRVYDTN